MKILDIPEIETAQRVEVLVGDEVFSFLSDEAFVSEWDQLQHSCPWATVFQGKEFVAAWYKIYYGKHLPIVVKSTQNGKLDGLLTLAKLNGEITAAGGKHAEYQTWLAATPPKGEEFIKTALYELRKRFPGIDLKLKFVPEKTPLSWIKIDPFWRKRCVLRAFEQPLLLVDEDGLNKELRKKNRKEKINRLKRLGNLKFERIKDLDLFLSNFDNIIVQYDFRNGARYNKIPSQVDPLRKKFILELFKLNLLHATTLKLNDEIIASSVIAIGNKWLHLWGITSYTPSYAKYSPSILHYLMLGKLLIEEGFEVLDLTPGDDPYKKELATGKAVAYELRVAGSVKSHLKDTVVNLVWEILDKTGINRKVLKEKLLKRLYLLKETGIKSLFITTPKTDLKEIPCADRFIKFGYSLDDHFKINKDNLNDLLCYKPSHGNISRWEFLENSLKRFQAGQHSYTYVGAGHLLGCIWVINIRKPIPKLANGTNSIPDLNDEVLQGLYCHPSAKGKMKCFIQIVTYETGWDKESGKTSVLADTRENELCKVLKEAGFNVPGKQ